MDKGVPDEQLFSWVDRDAPELAQYLHEHPEDEDRVEKIRAVISGVTEAVHPPLPERIGPYEVKGILGTGAMGVVYEAVQPSTQRPVALKVVHAGLQADKQILRYFQREARLLARLSHPAIATVYEAGTTEAGEPYLAMELARGRPLSRFLSEENPDRRTRLRVVQRIASAVHVAHETGVIHRDLKPSNVFVDEAGNPMVLDFGLARLAQPEAGSLWSHGSSRHLVGTLQYMSPEQAFGRVDEIDRRTDVYSLGVMLHETLLGRRPYDIEGLSLPDALERIKVATPSWTSAQRRDLGGGLQAILMRALEKDPARRYPTAAALADDIARFLDSRPIEARAPGWRRRLGTLLVRHKVAAAALVLCAVALGIGLWLGGGADPGPKPTGDLRAPFVGGRGESERSPFTAVRWEGDTPLVRYDGRWFEIETLEGHRIGLILEVCKQGGKARWRKRFREDLLQVLERMGPLPGNTISMQLWDVDRGESVAVDDVPMSKALRRTVHADSLRSAYTGFRCPGDTCEVDYEGRWYELRALEGVTFAQLRQKAIEYGAGNWKRFLILGQVDLLTDVLNRSPGDTVLLELIDLETGEERLIDDASFSQERAATLLAATAQSPERKR